MVQVPAECGIGGEHADLWTNVRGRPDPCELKRGIRTRRRSSELQRLRVGVELAQDLGVNPHARLAGGFLATVDFCLTFHCLKPEHGGAFLIEWKPRIRLVEGGSGPVRAQGSCRPEGGVRLRLGLLKKQPEHAELIAQVAIHWPARAFRLGQIKSPFPVFGIVFGKDIFTGDLGSERRQSVASEPLCRNQPPPEQSNKKAGDHERPPLPRPALLHRGFSRPLSKSQTAEHHHPPAKNAEVQWNIHDSMDHCRRSTANQGPTHGPTRIPAQGIRAPDAKDDE